MTSEIEAVAFDCFGTLIDFGDEAFAAAYGVICTEQGLQVDGKTFYDKWMEVWRRLIIEPDPVQTRSSSPDVAALANTPGPLSQAEEIPSHPEHHAPSAGRNRALDGPVGPFRTYREEWTEHFALCFEELQLNGDAARAHERMVELMTQGRAFPESRRVVEQLGRRMPVAMMSNADDDFLYPTLSRNGLAFPVVVSSESARAYKPHVNIFKHLSEAMGLPPERILYVGDSRLADVTGAKNAGMKAAWLNRRRNTEWSAAGRRLAEPDHEIATLDGVLDIVVP